MDENAAWRLTQQTALVSRAFVAAGVDPVGAGNDDGPLSAAHRVTERLHDHAGTVRQAALAGRQVADDTRRAFAELDRVELELDAADRSTRAAFDTAAAAVLADHRATDAAAGLLAELQELRDALGELRAPAEVPSTPEPAAPLLGTSLA